MGITSLWDGIDEAEIFERGKYFKPNFDGIVIVRKTLAKQTRNKGVAFIVELEVEVSNLPEDHPVGSKGTWFQKLLDKDVAFPSIAAWAAACAGYQTHQKDVIKQDVMPILKELMSEATASPDDNFFTGTRLHLVTTLVKTKQNTDFTRYDFYPAEVA